LRSLDVVALLVVCAACSAPPPVPAPLPPPPPPAPAPPVAAGPQEEYVAWASRVARQTGVPARALESYAVAEARLGSLEPSCDLKWVTLAGIGAVETDHGRHGSRTRRADGRPSSPIIGPRLDGARFEAVRDSDSGKLDGDTSWDHAVGPLQFIPSSWKDWATDGDDDGRVDPHDLDDAAVSAGRYLCAEGGSLDTAVGWSKAVLSYNDTENYLRDVHAQATAYAEAADDL
jgi:membrane-bound lytic murein transglycosylase B